MDSEEGEIDGAGPGEEKLWDSVLFWSSSCPLVLLNSG